MEHGTIREAVRDRYTTIAEDGSTCCAPSCCGSDESASVSTVMGYDEDQLHSVPEGADLGLGSGNPVAAADLQEGETVLDLGSGGGIDCFLAADKVGPTGQVIGVDMTAGMIARARKNAKAGSYPNVDFRLGEIEALPVADSTVDVIISNCVINLSPERDRVLAEALRVLKPGGRLVISDLVCRAPIPTTLREEAEAVTSCLPVEEHEYLGDLEAAGFTDVRVTNARPYPREAMSSEPLARKILEEHPEIAESLEEFASSVNGAIIEARKPIE
jgi:SAM-dependent methyltransferase